MDSFISHFKSKVPVQAAVMLLMATVAWGLGIAYTLHLNPQIAGDVQGNALQNRWAEKMNREHGSKVVIYGGSSCSFSIDGERLLNRFNLPTVNYGNEAGVGASVLTESVLDQVRSNDTLIVAMEPGLLTDPLDVPALGTQFSFAAGHSEWAIHPKLEAASVGWFQALAALRPGGGHIFTLLGKIAMRKPLMRYQFSDYYPSGWKQTAVRLAITGPAYHGPRLSDGSRILLRNLRGWCDQHHVRLAYSLPWSYTPAEKERFFQKGNIDFLLQINEFMPVLKDAHLGANTHAEYYADTNWHLNETGAPLRTDELGEQIKNWDVWTVDKLQQRESQL